TQFWVRYNSAIQRRSCCFCSLFGCLESRRFGRNRELIFLDQPLGCEQSMTDRPTGPLSGILVIDLTRVLAGPYATLMLNELGARIIKVEPPHTGDDSRHVGPFVKTPAGATKSGYYMSVNRGKESIALDLKADADRKILAAL